MNDIVSRLLYFHFDLVVLCTCMNSSSVTRSIRLSECSNLAVELHPSYEWSYSHDWFQDHVPEYSSTMVDEATKKTLAAIPLLRTNAGPRDGATWPTRLKEEYLSLIKVTILYFIYHNIMPCMYRKATPYFSNWSETNRLMVFYM